MADKERPVAKLVLEPGEPREGAWCPTCLLPSAFEADLLSLTDEGVSLTAVVSYCDRCEQWEQRDP